MLGGGGGCSRMMRQLGSVNVSDSSGFLKSWLGATVVVVHCYYDLGGDNKLHRTHG